MRRFGGSSGNTCPETDMNLLQVLSENEGTLPRKTWATSIIRGTDRYFVIYRKCNPLTPYNCFTHVEYSPPRDGGQFNMPDICVSRYPVLGEMSYLKMQTVCILVALNKWRLSNDLPEIALGPIEREMENITIARKSYETSPRKSKMFKFITAFNKLNGYSMVAYPVGMHMDLFRDGESLENKILFTLPRSKCGSLGCGGSIFSNRFVYALLDW